MQVENDGLEEKSRHNLERERPPFGVNNFVWFHNEMMLGPRALNVCFNEPDHLSLSSTHGQLTYQMSRAPVQWMYLNKEFLVEVVFLTKSSSSRGKLGKTFSNCFSTHLSDCLIFTLKKGPNWDKSISEFIGEPFPFILCKSGSQKKI